MSDTYFKNLNLISSIAKISKLKTDIYQKSFYDTSLLFDKVKENLKSIPIKKSCTEYEGKKWTSSISGQQQTYLKSAFNKELSSTGYILKVISNSVISSDPRQQQITIEYIGEKIGDITGIWENDKHLFKIVKIGNNNLADISNSRLIMGFGPSASGKTYWAKNIIKILSTYSQPFPNTFMTIDGGDYRELSEVYQIVVDTYKKKNYAGLAQLVLTSFSVTQKSLFESNIIKRTIINYLNNVQYIGKISLYVPETLGGCGGWKRPVWCSKILKPLIDITGDKKYIGLMIYQHKTGDECDMDIPYKCVGCISSGKMREVNEGKKYSSGAYEHSYTQGEVEVKKATPYRFIIHNSGGRKTGNVTNKSIFKDLSDTPLIIDENMKSKFELKYGCVYQYKDRCERSIRGAGKIKNKSRKTRRKSNKKSTKKSRRTRKR